jgi:hypothetical protein
MGWDVSFDVRLSLAGVVGFLFDWPLFSFFEIWGDGSGSSLSFVFPGFVIFRLWDLCKRENGYGCNARYTYLLEFPLFGIFSADLSYFSYFKFYFILKWIQIYNQSIFKTYDIFK